MLSSMLFALTGSLCFVPTVFAAPDPSQTAGQSITLVKRQPVPRSAGDWGAWAKNEREALTVKYGGSSASKRSQGTNL